MKIDFPAARRYLQPEELAELDLLLAQERPTFREYINRVHPTFRWYRHVDILVREIQAVVDGTTTHLLIFMPPRLGKSEVVSRLLPGYWATIHPEQHVGMVSYGDALARTLSSAALAFYLRGGGLVATSGMARWTTPHGGSVWACGIGGPLTGHGFHLGLLDDPVKNAEEAASPAIQRRNQEWWPSTFYSRREPGARVILIQTRWHMLDPAGWLLQQEEQTDAALRWRIVAFDHIRDPSPWGFPPTCTVVPDWRAPGEVLCPERFPKDEVLRLKASMSSYWWSALHQQRPRPPEGNLFRYDWFRRLQVQPSAAEVLRRVRYWDTAGTEVGLGDSGDPDYTAGVRMALLRDGRIVIEDVVRGRWTPHHRDSRIRATADQDQATVGPVTIWLERETGVQGKDRTAATVRALLGYVVKSELPTGSKTSRAAALAAQAEAGNVYVLARDWTDAFLHEVCDFPFGAHDDMLDAAAGACVKLTESAVWRLGRLRQSV